MASNSLIGRAFALTTLSVMGGMFALPLHADPPASLSGKLALVPRGGMVKVGGYYAPQRLTLSTTRPAAVTKEPTYTGTPHYGLLPFGDAAENGVVVVVDESADGSTAKFYVDANHDGDLTNDAHVTWKKNGDGKTAMFQGNAEVQPRLASGAKSVGYAVNFYRFGLENATARKIPTETLLYYRDYAVAGEVTLGGKKYAVALSDETARGRFDVEPEPTAPATPARGLPKVSLLIDRDGDGHFDRRFEAYDLSRPFNLGGKTYILSSVSADGTKLAFTPSGTQVAEVPIPPTLRAGKPALAFSKPGLDGKTISFPGDFKGKVVLLDFWATWCGPCRAELPGLVKAYEKYHGKGFDVLGISLDQENQQSKVETFLKENNMAWPQIYDGKYWKADVAQMYFIDSIPHAFLVDGDTGKIIAEGNSLRGAALDGTISNALAAKGNAANR